MSQHAMLHQSAAAQSSTSGAPHFVIWGEGREGGGGANEELDMRKVQKISNRCGYGKIPHQIK